MQYLKDCICCAFRGTPTIDRRPDPVLDVEEILQDYAWKCFSGKISGMRKKCINRKDFTIEVPMNYFRFEMYEESKLVPRFRQTPLKDASDPLVRHVNYKNTEELNRSRAEHHTDSRHVKITTNYINDTGSSQTFAFRQEKTRKSVLSTSIQRGFTFGGKTNVYVASLNITITKTENDTIEETVLLETKSDITVKDGHKCAATIDLCETPVSYDLTAKTKLVMAPEGAMMTIKRKKDKKLVYRAVLDDIRQPFAKLIDAGYVEVERRTTTHPQISNAGQQRAPQVNAVGPSTAEKGETAGPSTAEKGETAGSSTAEKGETAGPSTAEKGETAGPSTAEKGETAGPSTTRPKESKKKVNDKESLTEVQEASESTVLLPKEKAEARQTAIPEGNQSVSQTSNVTAPEDNLQFVILITKGIVEATLLSDQTIDLKEKSLSDP